MAFPFLRYKQVLQSKKTELTVRQRWRKLLHLAGLAELFIVQRMARSTRYRLIRLLATVVNVLGNGWVYAPIAAMIFMSDLAHPGPVVAAAALSAAIGHIFHYLLKRGIARLRPFERDPDLQSLARVLDKYSFPSGHCMTLTAVLVPVAYASPALMPLVYASLGLLGCCRVVAAHHYPSDVLAGIGLGAGIALPVSVMLLA